LAAVANPALDEGLLIVMPAFNEAACVAATVREVFAAVPGARVLVVDDGSTDDTTPLARAAGAQVLVLPFNLGVGGAMRAGFKYAQRGGFHVVVQVDADGQHDPRHIPALLERLDRGATSATGPSSDGVDVVIGARFTGDHRYPVRGPRRWAMVMLARVLSRMANTRLTDTTSGFRASNARAIELYSRHYPSEYLGDTVESVVIALRSGLRVDQVPVQMRPRQGGAPSHSVVSSAAYLARATLALALATVRRWPDRPAAADVDPAEPAAR
jgi:glycosyltransferase involved in cell wall biosynthesis